MDFLSLYHAKLHEMGLFDTRWILQGHVIRSGLQYQNSSLVVTLDAAPADDDNLIAVMTQMKPIRDDLRKAFLAQLELHCVCAAGHPLVALYRTRPQTCICGSFFGMMEAFSKQYHVCAVTGKPLIYDGFVDGFHCLTRSVESTVKMLLRYCQDITGKSLQ